MRLYSRRNDLTYRFALIVEALARLRSRSCIIDGEAVSCEDNGMPSFDCILCSVFLYTFDPGGRQDALRQFLLRLRDPPPRWITMGRRLSTRTVGSGV